MEEKLLWRTYHDSNNAEVYRDSHDTIQKSTNNCEIAAISVITLHSFCVLLAHPYSTIILGGVPVAPDRPCWGQQAHRP